MKYKKLLFSEMPACLRPGVIPVVAVLAMGVLATPVFAGKGGSGGGASTPPAVSPYTVQSLPRAGWGNFASAEQINIKGDVAGEVNQTVSGNTSTKEAFRWKRGAAGVERLPALQALGHTVTWPGGISADGERIFGYSSPEATGINVWPVIWGRPTGGTFIPGWKQPSEAPRDLTSITQHPERNIQFLPLDSVQIF